MENSRRPMTQNPWLLLGLALAALIGWRCGVRRREQERRLEFLADHERLGNHRAHPEAEWGTGLFI